MLGRRPGAVGAQHAATYRDRDDQEAQERPQTSTGSERVHSAQHDGKTSRDCSRRPSRVPSFRRFVSGSWEIRRRLRRARSGECQETLRGDRRPPGRQSTNATRLAKPSSPSSAPFKEIKRRVERAFPRNSQEIPKTLHRTTAPERRRAQASASSPKYAVRVEEVCRDRARRLQNI